MDEFLANEHFFVPNNVIKKKRDVDLSKGLSFEVKYWRLRTSESLVTKEK